LLGSIKQKTNKRGPQFRQKNQIYAEAPTIRRDPASTLAELKAKSKGKAGLFDCRRGRNA
jgi:hypothetical protein